ncbi:MAG: SRPBCC family protein, partial [Brevundimonas sp.]
MSTVLKVEHRVGVKAPAEQLWERLADFAAWSHWNPHEAEVEGVLGFGAPLV